MGCANSIVTAEHITPKKISPIKYSFSNNILFWHDYTNEMKININEKKNIKNVVKKLGI
jgi:hypothetical protein